MVVIPVKCRLLFISWYVCVGGSGNHVVEEGQVLGDVLGGPGGEVGVEEALISAVERTLFGRVRDDGLEQSRRSD